MSKKENYTVQTEFINKLKDSLPQNLSLADELSDLLEVSSDSAYRRIRGETALSIDEVVKICKHYKIPFTPVSEENPNTITFGIRPLNNNKQAFENYLTDLRNDLKKITHFEDAQIIYAAEDIPIFHHFCFDELTAFKYFYWNKEILNTPFTDGKKFDATLIPKEWIKIGREIIELYNKIPSIEIWSEDTINGTLKQVEFFWDSGLFQNKEDALLITEQIEQMIKHLNKQGELQTKFVHENEIPKHQNNYSLYRSDVTIGNNCILVKMGNIQATYLAYHTLNFMTSTSASFSSQTEKWLKNLIKKATLISGTSEKYRYQFFKLKFDLLEKLKEKIKNS
jgi:hypothetical protein